MALPPQLIRIKRKRDDDSPVTFLQLDSNPKRHRGDATSGWVYRRKTDDDFEEAAIQRQQQQQQLAPPGQVLRPVIQESRPGDERRIAPAYRRSQQQHHHHQQQQPAHQLGRKGDHAQLAPLSTNVPTAAPGDSASHVSRTLFSSADPTADTLRDTANATNPTDDPAPDDKNPERRRFHYSRAASALSAKGSRIGSPGISKRERYGAVFVEKRQSVGGPAKRLPSSLRETAAAKASGHGASASVGASASPDGASSTHQREPSSSSLGLASVNGARRSLPSVNPAVDSMDHVAATMSAWALEEIGATLQAMDASKTTATANHTSIKKPASSRFRPKAPAKRWAERNPDLAQKSTATTMATLTPAITPGTTPPEADGGDEDPSSTAGGESDSDCVYDTYERVPIAHLTAKRHNPDDVGVLIIDDDDDADNFYMPEQDSEDEEEDSEDENAETHYTADYPEDELDSDDEHGLDAYKYRTGNASDEEQYLGEDDDDGGYGGLAHEGDLDDDDDEVVMARVRRYNRHINANLLR